MQVLARVPNAPPVWFQQPGSSLGARPSARRVTDVSGTNAIPARTLGSGSYGFRKRTTSAMPAVKRRALECRHRPISARQYWQLSEKTGFAVILVRLS
jgi:hypothetical protein